jgi:hypothetical protein
MEPYGEAEDRSSRDRRYRWLLGGAAALIVVLILAIVALVVDEDDDGEVVSDTTTTTTTVDEDTTTTSESTTSTTAQPTSSTAGTPTRLPDAEAVNVVWPAPDGDVRYEEAESAVQSFAEDLVGFENPLLGEYQAGDSRSGEIEVRAADDGPVTTVFVRQMSDDHWYVLGAATEGIELRDPIAGSAIDHPLLVSGRGRGFEGVLRVAVHDRTSGDLLGDGVIAAGSGPDLAAFDGEIAWDNPGGGWGVVVVSGASGEDGSVWDAVAVPVGFIGGD